MAHSFKHHCGANIIVSDSGKKYIYYNNLEFRTLAEVEKYKRCNTHKNRVTNHSYENEYSKFQSR
ncbi:MAG: hypothetical protein RR565_04935 [Erysipelothrix sp.]